MYPPSDVCKGPKIYQVTLNKHDHIWFIAHISGKIDEFIYLSQDDDDDDDQYDNDYHDHQNYDDIDDIFATLPLLLMDNPFDVDQLRKIQARCNNDYVDMVAIAYSWPNFIHCNFDLWKKKIHVRLFQPRLNANTLQTMVTPKDDVLASVSLLFTPEGSHPLSLAFVGTCLGLQSTSIL